MQRQHSWADSLAAMALHVNPGAALRTATGGEMASGLSISSSMTMNGLKKEERMPQWGYQETKDFIAIRSELERDFTQTKRNKSLWETIASKMKERGYSRSADQCKIKWKNLYNRYKAVAVSQEMETFPLYEELHAIFSAPHKALDGLFMESGNKKGRKGPLGERSSEDLSDEDGEGENSDEDNKMMKQPNKKPRKADLRERARPYSEKCRANNMQVVLEDFFQQQERVEMEWMEALHRRDDERRRRELEWKDAMEKLERERIAREQIWREREEQRRAREELRAQRRDVLFSALLSRLAKED